MGTSDFIVNVKDFGAKGDGSHDDTAAIQAAIDAAYGPPSAPHSGAAVIGTGYWANRPVYFPNGTFNISSPLVLFKVQGAHLIGAGKFATRIVNTNTSGGVRYSGTVLRSNGMILSFFEHMTLAAAAPVSASFTGSISGTTLTASSGTGIQPGQAVTGATTPAANSSLSWSNTSGPKVLVTTASAHGVTTGKSFEVLINGVTSSGPASYNGLFIATATSSTQFTYELLHDPGTETTPGTYSIYVMDGVPLSALSAVTWSGGVVTATVVSPHGVTVGNSFLVAIYNVIPGGYWGTYTATATGSNTFTYPLNDANDPGLQQIVFYNVNGGGDLAGTKMTWSSGTTTVVTSTPHGVGNGSTFTTVISSSSSSRFPDIPLRGSFGGFNGIFTATSTGTNTFTYPLATDPGVTIEGTYAFYPTIIVAGGGTTWTVSNEQSVGSMAMTAVTSNRGFEMSWDGSPGVALTGVTFRNVRFEGGDMGIAIGPNGFQGSEVLFQSCDFVGCTTGMAGFNSNALNFTVIGCSFQGCGIGIDTKTVCTFSYVSNVSFSGSTVADIKFDSHDGMAVEGCSSTSQTFLYLLGSVPIHTKACSYTPASSGAYATPCQAFLIMDGCLATNSVLQRSTGAATPNAVYMRGCNVPGTFLTGSTSVPGPYPNPPTGPVMEFF